MSRNSRTIKDPVCGTLIDSVFAFYFVNRGGRRYAFCSPACKKAFEANPGKYIKTRGIMGRFLDGVVDANDRESRKKDPGRH